MTTKPKHPGGRPSDYNDAIADEICRRLITGESLNRITKDPAMPSIPTVYSWIGKFPEFLKKYEKAKEDQTDTLADEILEIADNTGDDDEGVQRSRLRIDTRKWIAERMKPHKYGVRSEVKHSGEVAVTLADLLKDAT